jgi:hypothetical protein
MPKSRSAIPTLIKTWIALYKKTDQTIFTADGSVVFCQLYDEKIVCSKKFQLQQHVDTALHNSALKRRGNKNKKQLFVLDAKPKSGACSANTLCNFSLCTFQFLKNAKCKVFSFHIRELYTFQMW